MFYVADGDTCLVFTTKAGRDRYIERVLFPWLEWYGSGD